MKNRGHGTSEGMSGNVHCRVAGNIFQQLERKLGAQFIDSAVETLVENQAGVDAVQIGLSHVDVIKHVVK